MPAAKKSSVNFAAASAPFIAAGISDQYLIPVIPHDAELHFTLAGKEGSRGKIPGSYRQDGAWSGLGGVGLLTQGTTEAEVKRWATWPTPNVGVLGVAFPAIDSDAESAVAAKLVQAALVKTFGKDVQAAIRLRGKGHRLLYAFEADDKRNGVRSRTAKFTPKGDDKQSGVDIKAKGGQWLASGTHPSGDKYMWDEKASLLDPKCPIRLIVDEDIDAFLDNLKAAVEAQGGTWDSGSAARGGSNSDFDTRDAEPIMTLEDCLRGLNMIPNSRENFPNHEDLVAILASIRAALGREADDAVGDIREWACHSAMEPGWCSEDYFDKTWRSLGTVRVSQDTLERSFRKKGVTILSETAFPKSDGAEIAATVAKVKDAATADRASLLEFVADQLAFRDANNLEAIVSPMVRSRDDITSEIKALSWWKMEDRLADPVLLTRIHREDSYPRDAVGLANFMRDMHAHCPHAFFSGTIKDPRVNPGVIVTREADGQRRRLLNTRRQSSAIMNGRLPSKDKARDREDVDVILDLMGRMFGAHVGYELDTLAYMAQTGNRPGSMLFLVGDKGVGKTIYINMLQMLFDGKSAGGKGNVDGNTLTSESGRRFAYSQIEGCRIVSLKEVPAHMSRAAEAEMTSAFKNMCDRGAGGDLIAVESKGQPIRWVENVCRVVVSSNHHDAIEIEDGDRRIFYVDSGINVSNKFSERFYGEFSDISEDPIRLAAFWRFLIARNISKYSAFSAPPTTEEKLRRAIMSRRPVSRHFAAAVALLNASNREFATNVELKKIMHRMSVLEHENTAGHVDDIFDYTELKGTGIIGNPTARELAAALRSMPREKFAQLDRDIRTGNGRERLKVYVLERGMRNKKLPVLEDASGADVVYYIEDDVKDHPLGPHPLPEFRDSADEPEIDI